MIKVAAVILTKDEVQHVAACVASVQPWVDEVVVWGSTDVTSAVARQAGARVVVRPFDNFAAQRQAALDGVDAEWILFVDVDERVTPALGQAVQQAIAEGRANGYWIPRRNFIVNHETRGGGFFPDYQLRLLRRSVTHYDLARTVHELPVVAGEVGCLQEPMLHYNYADWGQFHRKQWVYATYEAQMLAKRGIRPRPHNFILQPLREFRRRLITLRGWQDGWHGWRLAGLLAWYYGFIPYWILLTRPVG